MTPNLLREKVVTERMAWVREMLAGVRTLPLRTLEDFLADRRNPAAAESYLRRALEALLDLGRHILAKGFGTPAVEYKQVARVLEHVGILDESNAQLLERLAGYRNRMVHFYSEVTEPELYELCAKRLGDLEDLLDILVAWVRDHPDRIDRSL
jgi:uncharacterized protein YutE (UPF0331/DUF86 family)